MKKSYYWLLSCAVILASCTIHLTNSATPKPYVDPEIEELLVKMTIEEKVGQMTQLNLDVVCVGEVYKLEEPHHLDPAKLRKALVEYHVGSILNCGGHAYPREQWLELIKGIQDVATTETRLKIPILYGIDAIHGANYVMGSTLFPQPIGQAATFNEALVKKGSEITAYETRAVGIPWNFSPVLDVARNPLWSRVFETYGEDPLVCSRMGVAAIEGYQGNAIGNDHVAACMKHFLGYSATRTGKDRTPAYIPDNLLREYYLPPFQAAVKSGAMSVMINSGEINGIPVHANKAILQDLLRDELQFTGVAVTDWEDIIKLQVNHKVAPNLKEATYMAISAGIDMCMVPNDYNFTTLLIELVKEGRISETRLNTSVRRILTMKKKLGILKSAKVPTLADYPNFNSTASQAEALKTAEQSITLLENKNNILPLQPTQKVFVTGPASQSINMLNGAWTRTWQGVDTTWNDPNVVTIAEAFQMENTSVTLAQGCAIDRLLDVDGALKLARESDVIVACMGEIPSTEKPGDINDLTMDEAQLIYVEKLLETGKPVVLVLVENRPRVISRIADRCAAVIMAYLPGDQGGKAIANVVYGKVNPSGRLPFTYPRFVNDLANYDHKYTETFDSKYGNNAFNPQWPFGHGLHYGEVKYENMRVEPTDNPAVVRVTVRVINSSSRPVSESVLLFGRDHFALQTPAVKKLLDFKKVELNAAESMDVAFTVDLHRLGYMSDQKQWTIESGDMDLMIDNLKKTYNYQAK